MLVLNITYIYTGIEFPCLARKASKLKCQSTSFLTATIQSFRCCFAKCIFGVLFVVSGLLLSGDESLANFWIVFSVLSHSPESILLELFFAKARGLPSLFQCYNSVLCLHLRKICSSAVYTSQCTVTNSQITILFIMCNGIAIQTSGQRFSVKISSFTSQVSLPFDRVRTFKMRI